MKLLRLLLYIYKNTISVLLKLLFGGGCKYRKTCSEYTVEKIEKYGIIRGGYMGIKRVVSCNSYIR